MCPANVGRWRLDAHPDGASCTRTEGAPDVVATIPGLSALCLGGMSVHHLGQAGLLTAAPEALGRLGRLLAHDPEPHNSFAF